MKYMQKRTCLYGISFGLPWLCGCGTEDGLKKVYTFPKSEWHTANRLLFECKVVDPNPYDVVVSVYYTLAYPYQNLYIKYDLEGVETSESGLIELQLFDRKRGQPLGSGWGGECKCHQLCVRSGYSFKKAGTYFVRLAHFMRQDPVTGIVRVMLKASC